MMIRLRPTRAGETCLLIRVRWDPERGRSAQRVLHTFPADSGSRQRTEAGITLSGTDQEH
jgi:hypothetical protein